jgi:hypothetical protein
VPAASTLEFCLERPRRQRSLSTNTISGRRKERSIVTLHTKVDGLGGRGQRKESIRGTKDDDILSSHGLPYSRFLPRKIESETRFHVVKPRNLKGNRIT